MMCENDSCNQLCRSSQLLAFVTHAISSVTHRPCTSGSHVPKFIRNARNHVNLYSFLALHIDIAKFNKCIPAVKSERSRCRSTLFRVIHAPPSSSQKLKLIQTTVRNIASIFFELGGSICLRFLNSPPEQLGSGSDNSFKSTLHHGIVADWK